MKELASIIGILCELNLTFMDCILDNALKGLNPLNVRMVLNTGMLPAPTQVADKLSRETLNVSKNIRHQIFY